MSCESQLYRAEIRLFRLMETDRLLPGAADWASADILTGKALLPESEANSVSKRLMKEE